MCGRFASTLPPEQIAHIFGVRSPLPNAAPNWNLAPTQSALVVRWDKEDGARHLAPLAWGLLPHFEADPKKARLPINARAETVQRLPSFRSAFRHRRCLVPAEAFYEWRRDGKLKQPFAIARADGAPLAFGGLWESWRDPASGHVIRTFAIITMDANATMTRVHNRMPLVLETDSWPLWLGETEGDAASLLRPAPENVLRLWPVSTRVNSVWNNGAELLKSVDEEASSGGPNSA